MRLTRHQSVQGPRWALDGHFLPPAFGLGFLLELPKDAIAKLLRILPTGEPADGPLLAPLEPTHEVWASGVTYLRSRDARMAESEADDVYDRVYDADRPELFPKAIAWRVVGHEMPVRIRQDSRWNVPEPEVTLGGISDDRHRHRTAQ